MNKGSLYKPIAALFLLVAFLAQTFSRVLIIADYYSNTGKYARNCENKARPQFHCNGKCQMMKRLRQEERKDEKNPERRTENNNETLLSSKSFFATPTTALIEVTRVIKIHPRTEGSITDRCFDIFHPPQLS